MSLDKQSVEQRVNRLEEGFSDLIDCTYKALLEKKVDGDVRCFRSSLLSVKVSQKHIHQEFIHEHLLKVDKETTFDDLWIRLSNYCNFLNFDLLEHVISKFGGEDLKHKMECYKCELQSFRKATRLCDFIDCWPVQGETPPETDLKEFVAKMKHNWENCTLEDLETLKGVITRKFFMPEFAIKLKKIMEGSIVITWLIPAPLVTALQEAVKTTSSDFFLEHKIETITIDRKVCHPSPSRKHVDYPKEQFTSQSMGGAQRKKSPLGVLPEKLHSFISGVSKEETFLKETHRTKLAEEILSGESTSMVPSEEVQFVTYPGDIQGEKSTPSFLSKLKQMFSIRSQVPSKHLSKHQQKQYTSETFDPPTPDENEAHTSIITSYCSSYSSRVPSSLDTPTLEEMEELSLMPEPHTRLGGTISRTGSSSKDWSETSTPPEKNDEHTSMILSEKVPLSTYPIDTHQDASGPRFLPATELREFVIKIGQWENCTFRDLGRIERFIIFSFFQSGQIMESSVTITWLIPVPFVKGLQEAVETTSSRFVMEQNIESITVGGKECYSSLTRKVVDYPKEQSATQSMAESQQSEMPPVSILTEKLRSIKSGTSDEQPFPKETYKMRLTEEILSSEATSMVPSEEVQFGIHPGDTQQDASVPSFLQEPELREFVMKFSHDWENCTLNDSETIKGFITSNFFPSEFVLQLRELIEGSITITLLIPAPIVKDLQTKVQRTSSELFMEQKIATITIDGLLCHSYAEEYVRKKSVDEISLHIKLLPSVEQYLSKTEVEADPSFPTKYKDYLTSTPAIRAALYTTFNARMAAEVFSWSQHTESPPPTTMTELYTAFTLKTLVDHLSTHPVYCKQQLKVTTFSDLPTDVYKQFQDLCRMAYEGILNKQQLVFSAAHLPTGFAPLGLMQEVPQLYTEGRASSYHFIHLILQEYLAAVHISQLPAHEQTRLFQEHGNSGHFKMTMKFLAGCTKLANIPPDITRRLMKSAELTYSQLLEAEDISVSTEHLHLDERARRLLEGENAKLTCFHFLFEAKDISMTTRTLGSDEIVVESYSSPLTPLDYYVTGHAISHSNCPWRLDFIHSSIDDDDFELFCQGCAAQTGAEYRGYISYAEFNRITSKSIQSFVNIPPHILQDTRKLKLGKQNLDGSACDLLAKVVSSMSRLNELSLNDNPIGTGGTVKVIKALGGSRVQKLDLGSTGIGVPDCEALCELLKSSHSINTTLRFLDLSHNAIGEGASVLAEMLVENKSLTDLVLEDCHISRQGASELAAALSKNSTLKVLDMNHNPVGLEGASSMSDMLQHNTSLEELKLHDDSVWHKGVWQLIDSLKHNQTLKKLQLPEKYKTLNSDHRIKWQWW